MTSIGTGGATGRIAWIDASNGIAGDMLLGALIDAGAPLAEVQAAVDLVIPGAVQLRSGQVHRAGMRATKVEVEVLVADQPHRTWASIKEMLANAGLPELTRARAHDAFERVAVAEARVHGTTPEEIHFHEVGALDSIADTVGVCEAIRLLGITEVVGSPVAVGSGFVNVAHGRIPVPVPAVVELALGWPTLAGDDGATAAAGHSHAAAGEHGHEHGHEHGRAQGNSHEHGHSRDHDHENHQPRAGIGELATPTGVALMRALARTPGAMPPMVSEAVGIGAGTKDFASHPNVVRVIIGQGTNTATPTVVHQLESNVDDLDPRLWPGVINALLAAGAVDAWLSPITMKKGRPAHTLHALASEVAVEAVTDAMLANTTTLGVRRHQPLHRVTLQRTWFEVQLGSGTAAGHTVRIKVAHDGTQLRGASPEFEDCAAVAAELGISELEVLEAARAAATLAGLVRGAALPS